MREQSLFSLTARNHEFFSIGIRIGQEMVLLTCKVAIHSTIMLMAFYEDACFSAQASQLSVFQGNFFEVPHGIHSSMQGALHL